MEAFSVFVPDNRLSVANMSVETGLSKSMLSIFNCIYGLHTIPIFSGDIKSLLRKPLEMLFAHFSQYNRIHYVIYIHTASWISLIDDGVDIFIRNNFPLSHATIFETTLYKCVGFFKAIELLQSILLPNALALIVMGDIAFTPKLRIVPRSTIVGDASAAALIGQNGVSHHLLAIHTKFIPQYEQGIYVSDQALRAFESCYIAETVSVIHETLSQANIALSQIQLILPHNVNIPTWHKISDVLAFPTSKVFLNNISKYGHCFCSDHLINLQSAIIDHVLQPGDYYLMVGCGLGFFISAAVWRY